MEKKYNKNEIEMLNKIISNGTEIEGMICDEGRYGIDLNFKIKKLRKEANKMILKLSANHIYVNKIEYKYIEDGIEWELDYALQFI